MSDRGASRSRAALAALGAVAGTVLVLLLAVWAASIGTDAVFSGPGPAATESSEPPAPATPTATETEEPQSDRDEALKEEPSTPPTWLRVIALLSQITTGLVLAYALYRVLRWLRRRWRQRERRAAPLPQVDFEVLDDMAIEETAEAIVAGSTEQREVLLGGTPRNAIVACWHRFEIQAEQAGMRREVWETSAEFTLRILDRVAADPGPVAELGQLYREARFSEHVQDESARERAIEALDRIHAGLGSRTGARLRR